MPGLFLLSLVLHRLVDSKLVAEIRKIDLRVGYHAGFRENLIGIATEEFLRIEVQLGICQPPLRFFDWR